MSLAAGGQAARVDRRAWPWRGGSGLSLLALAAAALMIVQGCGASATTPSTSSKTKVVLATGFQPSMNSAPYYLAQARGYYAAQGLDVEIKDGTNPALLQQVGSGAIDFGVTSGDSLLLAQSAGIPAEMVMQQFTRNPVGAIALAPGGVSLASPSSLRGLRVGVSAPNGSTYFGLLALLAAAHLSVSDVDVVSIGFTELEALAQRRVSVAMTYLNNEPVQARQQGIQLRTLGVSRYLDLVSTGLASSQRDVKDHPDLVRRFVKATLLGLRATLDDPQAAAKATLARMPEATPSEASLQRQILLSTLPFERPAAGHQLGWTDPAAWKATDHLLSSAGATRSNVALSHCYTNQFVAS
ncbi:MAG: ABC transporter substrate-binding protein [Candidatus Dormiibacterota bacterium]